MADSASADKADVEAAKTLPVGDTSQGDGNSAASVAHDNRGETDREMKSADSLSRRSPRRSSGQPGRSFAKSRFGRVKRNSDPGLVEGPVLRHNKAIYSFGNYDMYYSKRHDRCAEIDPRIEALLQHLGNDAFVGKSVLDMGCNSGFLTFLVAALGARNVEGVDIDLMLISKALKRLRRLRRTGCTTLPEMELPAASASAGVNAGDAGDSDAATAIDPISLDEATADDRTTFPRSCVLNHGIIPYQDKPLKAGSLPKIDEAQVSAKTSSDIPKDSGARTDGDKRQGDKLDFPYNLEFRTENILVSEVEEKRGCQYDILLCLKLSKWVHLHWGDDGLKLLLHKCFRMLRPGGMLVLEAQEWSSYQSSKHLTPHMKQNRTLLRLRPQDLGSYLVREVGFKRCATVDNGHINRPLELFKRVEAQEGPLLLGQMPPPPPLGSRFAAPMNLQKAAEESEGPGRAGSWQGKVQTETAEKRDAAEVADTAPEPDAKRQKTEE
eukprot:TRINITY_DN10521_c0_g9_i1.p1 TRINITY_DN10521_c0_g9~~TRINITY_DN10521_c0_g9_i1.p1  ORF type:complete len:495 (-),score=99.51 TRINITY_DN10521_c0_g9_i1:150-1634(-)